MAISQISIRSWRNTQELRLPWFPPLTVSYFTRVIARNPQPTAQRLEMICGDELCSCSEGFTPAGWVIVGNQGEMLPPNDINGAGKFCGSCWLTQSQPGVGAAHKEQVISAPFLLGWLPAELTSVTKHFGMAGLGFIVLQDQNTTLLLKAVLSTKHWQGSPKRMLWRRHSVQLYTSGLYFCLW